jgi:hypothetical protein
MADGVNIAGHTSANTRLNQLIDRVELFLAKSRLDRAVLPRLSVEYEIAPPAALIPRAFGWHSIVEVAIEVVVTRLAGWNLLTRGRSATDENHKAQRGKAVHVSPNVRVEQRAAVLWMLALYPSRVCSNALLGDAHRGFNQAITHPTKRPTITRNGMTRPYGETITSTGPPFS